MSTKYYFEGSLITAPLSIASADVIIASETVTLKRLIHKTQAQRWDLSFGLLVQGNEAGNFLGMIENTHTVATMDMPQLVEVEAATTITGGMTASNNYAAGATNIVAANSSGGTLPKGSFIKFNGHTKIYVTTTDWTSDGDNFDIYPSLRQAVSLAEQITHANSTTKPQLSYLRETDTISGISYSDGILATVGSITIKEVV
jgi:hypothetical protein